MGGRACRSSIVGPAIGLALLPAAGEEGRHGRGRGRDGASGKIVHIAIPPQMGSAANLFGAAVRQLRVSHSSTCVQSLAPTSSLIPIQLSPK